MHMFACSPVSTEESRLVRNICLGIRAFVFVFLAISLLRTWRKEVKIDISRSY